METSIGKFTLKHSREIKLQHVRWDHKMERQDSRRMWDLGAWDETNNNSFKEEPSAETIAECAFILEKYFGRITAVSIWYCEPIEAWRVCFGN